MPFIFYSLPNISIPSLLFMDSLVFGHLTFFKLFLQFETSPLFGLCRFFLTKIFACLYTHTTCIYYMTVEAKIVCMSVLSCSLKMSLFVSVRLYEDSCSVSIRSSTTFPAVSFEVRLSITHLFTHTHTLSFFCFVVHLSQTLGLCATVEQALFLTFTV